MQKNEIIYSWTRSRKLEFGESKFSFEREKREIIWKKAEASTLKKSWKKTEENNLMKIGALKSKKSHNDLYSWGFTSEEISEIPEILSKLI